MCVPDDHAYCLVMYLYSLSASLVLNGRRREYSSHSLLIEVVPQTEGHFLVSVCHIDFLEECTTVRVLFFFCIAVGRRYFAASATIFCLRYYTVSKSFFMHYTPSLVKLLPLTNAATHSRSILDTLFVTFILHLCSSLGNYFSIT